MDSAGETAAWPYSGEDSGEDSEELDEEEARQLRELDEEMDRFEAEHPAPSLQEHYAEIEHINDRLWRLSATLRNPTSTKNRLKKSESCDKSHFKSYDVSHIMEKFPGAAEFLVRRLGEANTRRRQLLEYHRTHHGKISRYVDEMPLEAVVTEGKSSCKHQEYDGKLPLDLQTGVHPKKPMSQAEISQTTASKFVETPLKLVETSSDTGVSQTSYAHSETSASKYRLQVPFLADTDGCNGSPFQCAICFMIIQIGGTRDWKNHVFDDLRPYVCTFDDCTQSSMLFETRHEWFEHELEHHRRCWTCRHCNITFTAKAEFSKHLEELHPELVQIGAIESVVAGCQRVLDKHECPLCPGTYSTTRMRGHLADHLQQAALFVLRTEQDDVSEIGSNSAIDMDYSPYSSETWSVHHAESRLSPALVSSEAVSGNSLDAEYELSELQRDVRLLLQEISHSLEREKQCRRSMGDRQSEIEPRTVGLQDFADVFMVTLAEFSSFKQGEVVFGETLPELLVLKQPLEDLHHELTNPDARLKYTLWSPTLLEITKSWSECMIQFKALVERGRLLDNHWKYLGLNKITSSLEHLFHRIHCCMLGTGRLSMFGSFEEAEIEAILRETVAMDGVTRTSETSQQLPRVETNAMVDPEAQEEEGVLHLKEPPKFPGGNLKEQLRGLEKLVPKQLEEIPSGPGRWPGVPEPTARLLDPETSQIEQDLSVNVKESLNPGTKRVKEIEIAPLNRGSTLRELEMFSESITLKPKFPRDFSHTLAKYEQKQAQINFEHAKRGVSGPASTSTDGGTDVFENSHHHYKDRENNSPHHLAAATKIPMLMNRSEGKSDFPEMIQTPDETASGKLEKRQDSSGEERAPRYEEVGAQSYATIEVHYPKIHSDIKVVRKQSHDSIASVCSREMEEFHPMRFDDDWDPEETLNKTARAKAEHYDGRGVIYGSVQTGPSQYRIVENRNTGVTIHHHQAPNSIFAPGTDLGLAFATDRSHTEACRKLTRIIENQGLCFCPLGVGDDILTPTDKRDRNTTQFHAGRGRPSITLRSRHEDSKDHKEHNSPQ